MKGDLTRELIVRKSAELFNRRGYDGTSLSDIMRETGLKKGGIYNHFQNKDEIALAAFDYSMRKVVKRYRDKTTGAKTAVDKLHAFIDVYESFYKKPVVNGGCPLMNTAMDASGKHPQLKAKALKGFNTFRDYLMYKLNDGIDTGELSGNFNSDESASFMMATLNGGLLMANTYGDPSYMTVAAKNMHQYVDEILKKK